MARHEEIINAQTPGLTEAIKEAQELVINEYFLNKSNMKEETIFKAGDKVYDIRYGWGEVDFISKLSTGVVLSVYVMFNDLKVVYTSNGYGDTELTSLLSFTEYTLEGFSQERKHNFKDGDLVWVRDAAGDDWNVRFYKREKSGIHYTYLGQDKEGVGLEWNEVLPFDENPLLNYNTGGVVTGAEF